MTASRDQGAGDQRNPPGTRREVRIEEAYGEHGEEGQEQEGQGVDPGPVVPVDQPGVKCDDVPVRGKSQEEPAALVLGAVLAKPKSEAMSAGATHTRPGSGTHPIRQTRRRGVKV